jgi:hypothetical protein
MKWFLKIFQNDNEVNEDVVMGFLFFVCAVVAGFVPTIPAYVFYTFVTGCLTFFGKKLTTDIMKNTIKNPTNGDIEK